MKYAKKVYLAYVERFSMQNGRGGPEVFTGASFNENEVLEWIKEARNVDHKIWYEEIPLIKSTRLPFTRFTRYDDLPREILVSFDASYSFNDWRNDCQWMDPVGRKAIIPKSYVGIKHPRPESETQQIINDKKFGQQILWRIPCPWRSPFLLFPFTEYSNADFDYGNPWTL